MKKPAGSGSSGMLSVCAGVMRGRVPEQQNTNGVRDLTGLSGFVGFLSLYRTRLRATAHAVFRKSWEAVLFLVSDPAGHLAS